MTLGSEPLTTAVTPPPMAGKGTPSTQVPAGPRALSRSLRTRRRSHSSRPPGSAPGRTERPPSPPGAGWLAVTRREVALPAAPAQERLSGNQIQSTPRLRPAAWPPAPLTWDCRVAPSPTVAQNWALAGRFSFQLPPTLSQWCHYRQDDTITNPPV